ncbi:hypothetical protein FACS1894187_17320 [Synergistales bacterium]|nr:hypothetical protein FACS1894187_17320 [Synergistales bacterium]
MNYTLMHKNVKVAELEINSRRGTIESVGGIDAFEHFPVGVTNEDGTLNYDFLDEWWERRSIPINRQGLNDAMEKLNIRSPKLLLEKCMGLSLSDQYWICPKDSDLRWSTVNFFENSFSEDVGNVLFGEGVKGAVSLISPDNTSEGQLKKKWIIADGKRCLVKGGSGTEQQEPLNEVLATEIMRRLDISHVPYTMKVEQGEKGKIYSICEDFITPQTELVSARSIRKTQNYSMNKTVYQHFLKCCDMLGIVGVEDAVTRMLTVDFLIVNEDRHFNNFGAIRNAETLKWIGIAPIYDSGTSMWYNTQTPYIGQTDTIRTKPFCGGHTEQLKLISSLDFVDFSKLSDIADVANEIYKQPSFIDDERRSRLCYALSTRVELLKKERDDR